MTQLVVLGVFTYRFTVDQEIVDLKDGLRNKQGIVKVSAPLLKQATVIDNKIQNISKVIVKQDKFNSMLAYYISDFPEKIKASKLTIGEDYIYIEGITSDIAVLKAYFNRLQKDSRFKKLDLKNINRTESGYSFLLELSKFTK